MFMYFFLPRKETMGLHDFERQEFDSLGNKGDYGIIDIDQVSSLFANHNNETIICTGSGAPEIYDQIENIANITTLPRFARINATQICRFADDKIKKGEFGNVEPLYIRPPDAKIPKKLITLT